MVKNGFTLVEIMIVVAIMGILATFGWNGMTGQWQRNAVAEAKVKVPMIIRNVLEKSFQEGRGYNIKLTTESNGKGVIVVQNLSGGTVSSVELSNKLKYTFSTNSGSVSTTSPGTIYANITEEGAFEATTTGGITITLTDSQNNNKLQIKGRNINGVNVGKIDIYSPNGSTSWTAIKGL